MITSANAKECQSLAVQSRLDNASQEAFLLRQRGSVRARMREINSAVAKEMAKEDPDAQKVDRLASAWAKFAEQERIIDGRPLPDSRRPAAERTSKKRENPRID
jgi:hypothetical protein